ncbi:MAG: hypothetical protein KGL39_15685 [Patescibacteria group bacterium]|nr:hypothetical protein [Patescibacteria group bacterium]
MTTEAEDANADSSTAAADTGADVSTDGSAGSSPAPGGSSDSPTEGDQTAASPPTTQDEELAEFKADVAKATGEKPANSESDPEPEVTGAKSTDEPAPAKGKEEDPNALSQEVEKSFKDRPEWQALTGLKIDESAKKVVRGTLRTLFKREGELAQAVEAAKPAQAVVQEMMQSVGGSEQGFTNMRHLIKSFDQDPAGAVPMLETLLNDAKKRAGLVLQSPELTGEAATLKQQLDANVIDQESYDKRMKELLELEQVRTSQKRTQQQNEETRQRQAREQSEQQTQAAAEAINQAEAAWVADKSKKDADFKAVEGLHGAFARQNALDFFNTHKRLPNATEAVAILENSLKQAKAEAKKFAPKPKQRLAVTGGSNGSSGNNRQQPASEFDEFKADVESAQQRHQR